MRRPFSAAASEEAHHRLRQAFEAEDEASRGAPAGGAAAGGAPTRVAGDRAAARAVGTAIHRALEELDPAAEPTAELERLRGGLSDWLGDELPQENRPSALAAAETLLDHVAAGPLWRRLQDIGDAVLARELPLLVAAEKVPGTGQEARRQRENQEGGTSSGASSGSPREGAAAPPVAYLAGAVDLLYRDPADGRLVVVDFKTDDVSDEERLSARAAVYAPQGRTYARAVATALALDEPPRVELWFLRPGRVVALDPESAAQAPPPSAPPQSPAAGRQSPSAADQRSLFDED
jgi:ATP-dependent exoDNAse (exonuclease V) beta subunit